VVSLVSSNFVEVQGNGWKCNRTTHQEDYGCCHQYNHSTVVTAHSVDPLWIVLLFLGENEIVVSNYYIMFALQGTRGLCQLVISQRSHSKYSNEVSDVNIVVDGLSYKMSLDKNSHLLPVQ
jgi:hypothetical protein